MMDYVPATQRASTPPPGSRRRAAHVARVYIELAAGIGNMARDLDRVVAKLYIEKAAFNPDQPRVPADNPGGGQWAGANSGRPASGDSGAIRLAAAIDYSNGLTGFSDIDDTTRQLSELLGATMEEAEFIPESTPQIYGTAVHVAFAMRVKTAGIPGIGYRDVEQSFLDGEITSHGRQLSIRTDVILRNVTGEVLAIYDVKTGNARLSAARVRELRTKTDVGSNVPVIELHVSRGASIKGSPARQQIIGTVTANLWRPEMERAES